MEFAEQREGIRSSSKGALADYFALTKFRITANVLLTAAGGAWLAPGSLKGSTWFFLLLGSALIVSGANALNMYIERDIDGRMARTKNRPLPAKRLEPRAVLAFGVILSALAVPALAIGVNATTALLAVLANVSYVLAYTPMKQRSHVALLVGAVPGAIPPLMGWTAQTGRIDPGGLALLGIMFFWQIPHFLAISLFRQEDYKNAGLIVMPNVLGVPATKRAMMNYTAALLVCSLFVVPLGVVGPAYLAGAALLGIALFAYSTLGIIRGDVTKEATNKWARRFFFGTIFYVCALFGLFAVGHTS